MVISIVVWDEDDVSRVVELPAAFDVCGECDGHGSHLTEGMRGHAYTADEFNDSFDEVEAAEYFKRGGRYDVVCAECKGLRVVQVVDESRLTAEQREDYEQFQEQAAQREHEARLDAITRRRECGLC